VLDLVEVEGEEEEEEVEEEEEDCVSSADLQESVVGRDS